MTFFVIIVAAVVVVIVAPVILFAFGYLWDALRVYRNRKKGIPDWALHGDPNCKDCYYDRHL